MPGTSIRRALRRSLRLACVAAAIGTTPVVAAGCGHTPGVDEPGKHVGDHLLYPGSDVQHHPRIYAIFLGRAWLSHTDDMETIQTLFRALGGSRWNAILGQYGDAAGPISNDVRLAGSWTDTGLDQSAVLEVSDTLRVGDDDILSNADADASGTEIDRALKINGWNATPDTQFMLFVPPGVDIPSESNCGVHSETTYTSQYYSVISPPQREVCGSWTVTVTHEYAETATDPSGLPRGWNSGNPTDMKNYEVADICNDQPDASVAGIPVAQLYDQRTGRCDGMGLR